MKLIGINGSIAAQSSNRKLLEYIQKAFGHAFDLEILEIDDIPMFAQDEELAKSGVIQSAAQKIAEADGVIIATPEHSHTVPPALKNFIEWMSFKDHPFIGKPVLVVGASYYEQGSSRAQLHLKQILEAPGVKAYAMPGDEFLLANSREAFDEEGQIKDTETVDFLGQVLGRFLAYVDIINKLAVEAEPLAPID